MATINQRLREAAKTGSELELRALLKEPRCDALTQDNKGMTALMQAACYGRERCVGLLLPAGDALAQDEDGWTALMGAALNGHEECVGILLPVSDTLTQAAEGRTASTWARKRGHKSLAQWIDDYAWAQSERADLGVATSPGAPRGRAAFRM